MPLTKEFFMCKLYVWIVLRNISTSGDVGKVLYFMLPEAIWQGGGNLSRAGENHLLPDTDIVKQCMRFFRHVRQSDRQCM